MEPYERVQALIEYIKVLTRLSENVEIDSVLITNAVEELDRLLIGNYKE